MSSTCPIPTASERAYEEIQRSVQETLMQKVYAALQTATEQAQIEIQAARLDIPPPSYGYFAATVHQQMYCTLCGADPETFAGGRADMAVALIRNSQNIAKHYWGADLEPYPRP